MEERFEMPSFKNDMDMTIMKLMHLLALGLNMAGTPNKQSAMGGKGLMGPSYCPSVGN